MTLLASVNRLRRDLREDDVSALDANDHLSNTLVDFINDAMSELLNVRDWSFLVRHDGQVWFPALREETTGVTAVATAAGVTTISLNVGSANSWSTVDVAEYTTGGQTGRLLARVEVTGGSLVTDTSYPVDTLSSAVNFPAVLRSPYRGSDFTSANGGFRIYAHEYALPNTVRRVLSVRQQETPLRLEFVDRSGSFDRAIPRVADLASDRAEVAYVGGLVTGTAQTTADQASGLGLMIWPVPSADAVIDYTYVYRFAALSAATETWAGVPDEHVRLAESMAFEKALDSNVEDDHERASRVRIKNESIRARLVEADARAPVRRVTPEIGSNRRSGRHPNSRWESQVVSS